MKIRTITYGRTRNIGNGESERLEMSAELQEGDNLNDCLEHLYELVTRDLFFELDPDSPTEPAITTPS